MTIESCLRGHGIQCRTNLLTVSDQSQSRSIRKSPIVSSGGGGKGILKVRMVLMLSQSYDTRRMEKREQEVIYMFQPFQYHGFRGLSQVTYSKHSQRLRARLFCCTILSYRLVVEFSPMILEPTIAACFRPHQIPYTTATIAKASFVIPVNLYGLKNS